MKIKSNQLSDRHGGLEEANTADIMTLKVGKEGLGQSTLGRSRFPGSKTYRGCWHTDNILKESEDKGNLK